VLKARSRTSGFRPRALKLMGPGIVGLSFWLSLLVAPYLTFVRLKNMRLQTNVLSVLDPLKLFVFVLGERLGVVVEVTKCISLVTLGKHESPRKVNIILDCAN
jgi:hypothetical protein